MYNVIPFTMHYVNLKIRHSQNVHTLNPSRETPTADACDIELLIDFGGNIQAEDMLHERPTMSVGSESIVDAIEEFAE